MTGKQRPALTLCLTVMAAIVTAEEVSLSRDLMPLFARSCTGCHQREGGNVKAVKQGPYLEKKSDIIRITGSMIMPGKPENSYLIMTMSKPRPGQPRHKVMPPERSTAPRLTDKEIQKVSDWIKAGAKDN